MKEVIKTLQKNSSEEVRIELTQYRGHNLVGMRVYSGYTGSKEMLPTRKGLTVSVELLQELIDALREAKVKAGEMGILKN